MEETGHESFRHVALRGVRNAFWGMLLLQLLVVVEIVRQMQGAASANALWKTLMVPIVLYTFILMAYIFYTYRNLSEDSMEETPPEIDPGTGAYTMDYVASRLEQEHRRAHEEGVSAVVGYVDMVNLDRVNHAYGHTVGDIVLKAMADLMKQKSRSADVLGRAGGDEFVLLMPGTTLQEARWTLDNIRQAVQSYRLDLGKKGMIDFLDCHFGMAVYPADGENPPDIVSAARDAIQEPDATHSGAF